MKKLVLMSAITLITAAPTMAAKSKKKVYKKKKTSVSRLKKTKKEKSNDHISGVRLSFGVGSKVYNSVTDEDGFKTKIDNPESMQVINTSLAKGYSMGGFISGSTGLLAEYGELNPEGSSQKDTMINGGIEQKFYMNFGSAVMFRPFVGGSATYASLKSDDTKITGYEVKLGTGFDLALGSTFFINLNASVNSLHLKNFKSGGESYKTNVKVEGNQYGVKLGFSF